MPKHHPDDEQIGDLGEREERRIEEGDDEEAGGAKGKRLSQDPADESTHTING